jgi:hypothetical protein
MAAIDDVSRWTSELCNSRSEVLTGSPLWAYKVTDVELAELQRYFKRLFSARTTQTVFNHYSNRIDKPLVLYIATWLQRNTKSRAKWNLVTESIGFTYDNTTRNSLIEGVHSGLKKWGISVHVTNSHRYLDTLYCHGGFPRSDMLDISNTHLMAYFERVLYHYASYQHSSELQSLARDELAILPESLQQESFSTLTTSLIEFLIELRDEYHLYDCNDPLGMLEAKKSDWKRGLPFLMIDDEAEVLVNKLLNKTSKVVRRSQHPVRLKRYLTQKGGYFTLNAEVYVNHTIHPDDLSSVFGGAKLPNYFELSTYSESGDRYRAASFSYRSGVAPRWMVSTLENIVTQQRASGELSYQLFSDGEGFAEGIYYRGEALKENLPWLFEDKPNQPSYLSQGSFRTKNDSVYAICSSEPKKASSFANCEKIGTFSGTNRDIYRVSGHVKIESMFGNFHIRTDESPTLDTKILVLGKRYHKILSEHSIYCGKPNLVIDEDLDEAVLNPREFFWVNKFNNKTPYFSNDGVVGAGSIVWVCDDEVRWVHQCIVLPEMFDVELIHHEKGNFEAKFSGLENVVIGMGKGQEAWLVEEPDELSGFYFAEVNVPSLVSDYVSFRVYWDNDLGTETLINVPIPIDSVVLIDRQNLAYRNVESGRLTVNDLNQLGVLIKSDLQKSALRVKADLMNKEKLIATVSEELSVEIFADKYKVSGAKIANLTSRLFRHGTVPDNTVNLTFYANNDIVESQVTAIHRYKQLLAFDKEKNQASVDIISKKIEDQKQCTLKMAPIWDLQRDPIIIKPNNSPKTKVVFDLPSISEYGTWLVWSEGSVSIRPRIIDFEVPMRRKKDEQLGGLGQLLKAAMKGETEEVDYEEILSPDSLEYAVKYLQFDKQRNKFDVRKMDQIIHEMSFDIDHQGWAYFGSLLLKVGEIEPDTFHVIKRLMICSNALTLCLLRDSTTFEKVWELSEFLPFEWTTIPFSSWHSAITIVKNKKSVPLEAIRINAPTVYEELILDAFSPMSAKSEYYSTIVKISLGTYKGQSEVWSSLPNDDSSIGSQFQAARSNLYSSHANKLMKLSQTKNKDNELIKEIEKTWKKSQLPGALNGFFHKPVGDDKRSDVIVRAQKLTIELPILLAFHNMGMLSGRLPGWALNYLSFLLSQLQQFDREWLAKSMSLAIEAASICLNTNDCETTDKALKNIVQEVENV